MSGVEVIPTVAGSALVIPSAEGAPGMPGGQGNPGGNVMAIGLFTAAAALSLAVGTDLVQTSGHTWPAIGTGLYAPGATAISGAGFTSANSRDFRLHIEDGIKVTAVGAKGDGVAADGPKVVNAIAYLKSRAVNVNGNFGGSAPLISPAGNYLMGTTTLNENHTFIHEGHGSGRFGPGAGGCTRFKWDHGAAGIISQFALTEGVSDVSGDWHDGSGGAYHKHFMVEGGFVGTEGEYPGIDDRVPTVNHDIYAKGWSGPGFLSQAGGLSGGGNVGGNTSVSIWSSCRSESNRDGYISAGSDANVQVYLNSEAVYNRRYGFANFSYIGSTSYISPHAATNGVPTSPPYCQSFKTGHIYAAVKTSTPAQLLANAPSGDATSTTHWKHIRAQATALTWAPDWSGGGPFRAGGDYIFGDGITDPWIVMLAPYSEDGYSFSQLGGNTLLIQASMNPTYRTGGVHIYAQNGIFNVDSETIIAGLFTARGPAAHLGRDDGPVADHTLNLRNNNVFSSIVGIRAGAAFAAIDMGRNVGILYSAPTALGHYFRTGDTYGTWTVIANIDPAGINLVAGNLNIASGSVVKVNSLQVVGARKTGWSVATGTATRTAFATGSVTLPALAEAVKALIDDLHATAGHGLIGA